MPKGPDHTSEEVNAVPNSLDGDGKSANRFPSLVCRYASNGVGIDNVPTPETSWYESFEEKPRP